MPKEADYWSAWLAGWMMASRTVLEAQRRMIELFLSSSRRREAEPAPRMAWRQVEAALPASAGDKPSPVRRGRPPKQRTGAAPRRRGGPRKKVQRSRE